MQNYLSLPVHVHLQHILQGSPYTALSLFLNVYYFNYRPDFEQAKFSCGTIVCEVNGFAIACSSTGYCAPHGSSKKIDGNGFVFKLN